MDAGISENGFVVGLVCKGRVGRGIMSLHYAVDYGIADVLRFGSLWRNEV